MKKIISFFVHITIPIVVICAIVLFVLNFKQLYMWNIENITNKTGISEKTILLNYDYIINFVKNNKGSRFDLPTIYSSEFGRVHFEEVRIIFYKMRLILKIGFPIVLITIIVDLIKNKYKVFKKIANFLFCIPIVMIIAFMINFNLIFKFFHKIIFRNNYWIFDPIKDPVINILPEKYFMQCGILICVLMIISGIIFLSIYKYGKKRAKLKKTQNISNKSRYKVTKK